MSLWSFFFLSVQKPLAAVSWLALPASANIAALIGDAALVPQTPNQPPWLLSYSATPGLHPASAETSASVRDVQLGSFCHEGFGTPGLPTMLELAQPAPAPFQIDSL